jgi:undecaprenyl-diphosphatase
MIEHLVLGITQGIAEWIPVSSEGFITLIKANFFGEVNIVEIVKVALFLHMGTFLAALVYFRKEVWEILKNVFRYQKVSSEKKKIINFLFIATLISGIIGFLILNSLERLEGLVSSTSTITLVVGLLLLITAFLQIKSKGGTSREVKDLNFIDSLSLGIVQGLAALPGLSRSGLTVSTLLLRKVEEKSSLKLSFLLSLPIVFAGNILLNLEYFNLSLNSLVGLAGSFIFGIITIHYLLKLAGKVNFGWFVFIFGILMVIAAFI